jgi:hypothetical protein
MKRPLVALFLFMTIVVLGFSGATFVAPDLLALSVPPDLFAHSISIASIAIAAPSFTINQWCELRKYSRAEFYRMKARGDGPDTIGQGRMTRVTPGADAKWLKAQERKSKQSNKAA